MALWDLLDWFSPGPGMDWTDLGDILAGPAATQDYSTLAGLFSSEPWGLAAGESYGDIGGAGGLFSGGFTSAPVEGYGDIGALGGLRGSEGYGDIGAIMGAPGLGLGPNVGIPGPEGYGDIGAAMGDEAVRQAVARGMQTPIQARPASTFSMKGLGDALKGLGAGTGRAGIGDLGGIDSGFAPVSPVPMSGLETSTTIPGGLLDVQRTALGDFAPSPIPTRELPPFEPLILPMAAPSPMLPGPAPRPLTGLERLMLER